MDYTQIKDLKTYKDYAKQFPQKIKIAKAHWEEIKNVSDKKQLDRYIADKLDKIILDLNNSKQTELVINGKTLRGIEEDKYKISTISNEIAGYIKQYEDLLEQANAKKIEIEKFKNKYVYDGMYVATNPAIRDTIEAKELKDRIENLVINTPSFNFYTSSEINKWEGDKRDILERASKLQGIEASYENAKNIFENTQRSTSTLSKAKIIVEEYFKKTKEIKSSLKQLEDYYSKYINIVKPAMEETKQDDIKAALDSQFKLYTEAKRILDGASNEQKQIEIVKDGIYKAEQYFKDIESINKDDTNAVLAHVKAYKDFYTHSVQKALNSLSKTVAEKLTNKQFEEKSLAGQIEYASKAGNTLGKTVADVVKDIKHNLSNWQKQEILNANSKGVTPIEMASIAEKIDRLSKTPVSFRNSFIPKFSNLAKLREEKQDTVQDYKNLLMDMRIAIMALPVQDNITNRAVQLIDDALAKNTISDMQKAYDIALSIQDSPDYMGKDDILRQQYDYYYADNKEVPVSAKLLETDNGRKIMQNMVNIAKAKTEQLRDIPNTAGMQKLRTDIEDKTNKAIAQTINTIKSIQQKQKQVEDSKKMDALVSKMRQESPERNRVYKVNEQGKPELQQVIPEEKLKMKRDLSNIITGINPDIAEKFNETDAYGNMLKAYNNNDSNEFYRNYKILENIKNTEMARANFIIEYQNMIQELNALKSGKQDMIVVDINNAINKISELFKAGTDESMNSSRDIYNEIIATIKSKEAGDNMQITPPVNQPVNNEQILKQGEVQNA